MFLFLKNYRLNFSHYSETQRADASHSAHLNPSSELGIIDLAHLSGLLR